MVEKRFRNIKQTLEECIHGQVIRRQKNFAYRLNKVKEKQEIIIALFNLKILQYNIVVFRTGLLMPNSICYSI